MHDRLYKKIKTSSSYYLESATIECEQSLSGSGDEEFESNVYLTNILFNIFNIILILIKS